jgi:polyhydroxybutyrate depolymerase
VSQGFDDRFEDRVPPRRRVPWVAIAGAVVVVIALVGLAVLVSKGQTEEIDDPVAAPPRSTTTLGESAMASGGTPTNGVTSQEVASVCSPIHETFPLPDRSCRIAVPRDLKAGETAPVVILLHGLGTSSEQEASHGLWRQAAVRDRFTLVLPEGLGSSWNAGGCCGPAKDMSNDDIGYLTAVLDQVSQLPTTDTQRIYVVGESNGGMMAYAFGCARADRIAAIVSIEGTPVTTCRPSRPIPVLHVAGQSDQTVPYNGGQSIVSALLGVTFPPVPGAVGGVAQAMGCGAPSPDAVDGKVTTRDWTNCGGGTEVRLVSIAGLGHRWPHGAPYDATTEIELFLGLAR